jgi:hypothetical protein
MTEESAALDVYDLRPGDVLSSAIWTCLVVATEDILDDESMQKIRRITWMDVDNHGKLITLSVNYRGVGQISGYVLVRGTE